jgi:peptidylamidoglycolate lyase
MRARGLDRPAAVALAALAAACSSSPAATQGTGGMSQGTGGMTQGTGGMVSKPPPVDNAGKSIERSPDAAHPGYEVVPGWLKLPPGEAVGQAVGVEVDSHNHVFFFHRADRGWGNTTIIDKPTIFMVDGDSGEILAELGAGLFLVPHGLTVDHDDNLWVTDVGQSLVFKLSHEGAVLAIVGAGNACACPGEADAFNMPTDVAVAPGGDIYVSDGYGNSRVAELTPAGAVSLQWGEEGIAPGQFHLPHGVAFDGRLYVADRANARIQIFDADGALLDVWSGPTIGRPWGLAIGADHHVFLIDGGDQIDAHPAGRAVELDHDGDVVTTWGTFGSAEGQFDAGHAISVGPDGSVYVVEQVGKRIQKFRPVPTP